LYSFEIDCLSSALTMENPETHLLVIRSSAMGDVAMTVPVLKAFNRTYPEIRVTVLTRAVYAPFFAQLTNVF